MEEKTQTEEPIDNGGITNESDVDETPKTSAGSEEGQDEMAKLQNDLNAEKDRNLRLYAEFENFRRRNAKERIELIGTANTELMSALLPVLDDFDRAIASNEKAENIDTVKEGFKLLHTKLTQILSSKGLKSMDSIGNDFDPDTHEAVANVPAPSKKEKGKIIDVAEKGYTLNDKIIRHPKVIVGS